MAKRMMTGRAAFLQLKYLLGLQESVVLGMADGFAAHPAGWLP